MKKLLMSIFAISACLLLVVGCDKTQEPTGNETEAESKTEASQSTETGETVVTDGETDEPTENMGTTENESATTHETETSKKDSISAECVVKKGNSYVIVLPISGKSIHVDRDHVKYLQYVTDEAVLAAETKITEELKEFSEEPSWTVGTYGDDEMCLVVEVIQFVEGADYMDEVGCGIDHHHIFFSESIIVEQ